jgi:hypothetical protein
MRVLMMVLGHRLCSLFLVSGFWFLVFGFSPSPSGLAGGVALVVSPIPAAFAASWTL